MLGEFGMCSSFSKMENEQQERCINEKKCTLRRLPLKKRSKIGTRKHAWRDFVVGPDRMQTDELSVGKYSGQYSGSAQCIRV